MAATIGKNLGKFKQWTGEKLGKANKTECSDEFQRLEQETDCKKESLDKLFASSELYLKTLEKKKKTADDKNKVAPIVSLSNAMISHGQGLPRDSPYGQAMIKVGEAQEQLASAQMEFAIRLRQNYINGLERALNDMKDFQQSRKKLESRRLDYNAKLNAVQKSKKEKPELEEQMRAAEIKYNETQDDTYLRMINISDSEEADLEDLSNFFDSQLAFFQRGVEILLAAKGVFDQRSAKEYYANKSARRKQSSGSRGESNGTLHRSKSFHSTYSNGYDDHEPNGVNNNYNRTTPSTPGSTYSNSGTYFDLPKNNDSYSDYSPGPGSYQRSNVSAPRAFNRGSPPETTPQLRRSATLPAPSHQKKVRVLYGFDGESVEELSIRKGDIVTVLDEIDDGWWVGEIIDDNGRRAGMFPSNYVEEIVEPQYQHPPLPKRSISNNNINATVGRADAAHYQPAEPVDIPNRRMVPIPGRRGSQTPGPMPLSRVASNNSLNRTMSSSPRPVRPPVAKPQSYLAGSQYDPSNGVGPCCECGCDEYTPNVFKKDSCNNCFHRH
ncbi:BAR-domain-containing protein [Basidiobolus meristosporus CBS 931.73]|uniref:BAR-domain-containing protein n=1 Tax=Basidiobolus meristosporus CBS 931.73 TaxID=1314790 RepID=A0A1Y1XT52_9FUNG|nr:BAR-domain-containing protein [Basidiobolus meristosporus CBS 931.73]|eukprot:ORX88931.1 BAR-domain-containing protein [Basidiobolus meristosporus CBS 931.73]